MRKRDGVLRYKAVEVHRHKNKKTKSYWKKGVYWNLSGGENKNSSYKKEKVHQITCQQIRLKEKAESSQNGILCFLKFVIKLKIAAVPTPVVHTVVSDINLVSRDGKLFA